MSTSSPTLEEIIDRCEDQKSRFMTVILITKEWAILLDEIKRQKAEIERLTISRDMAEKELDVLSASHKDLAHRLAKAGP